MSILSLHPFSADFAFLFGVESYLLAPVGPPLLPLGSSLGPIWCSRVPLGGLWVPLRALLGALWALLGTLGEPLGDPWGKQLSEKRRGGQHYPRLRLYKGTFHGFTSMASNFLKSATPAKTTKD